MGKRKIICIALVFILVLAAGAVASCGKKKTTGQAGPAAVEAKPVGILALKFDKASSYSELSGMLQPSEESAVSFEAAGRILEMSRKEGDPVNAGEVLARLDATEYSLQVAQTKAGLDKAQVNYQKAKDDLSRIDQLQSQGALSQSDYENAQNRFTVTEKDFFYAQQAYSLVAGSGPDSGKNQLKSPISGTVLAKLSSVGQLVGIGTPVYRIGQVDTLKVVLPVPDFEISAWKPGDQVTLSLYKDTRDGKITRLFPSTNQGTGTIGVEVTLGNPLHDWYPGQVVKTKHILATREGLFIPVEAVLNSGEEKPYVFLAINEKAVKTPVTTGELMDNRLEILSGLKAGDQVIVKGADQLFDGNLIKQAGVVKN